MFRMEENTKDDALLRKLHLELLPINVMADDDLAEMIQEHNAHLVKLRERIDVLVADRERLADPTQWLETDDVVIGVARNRVRAEGWNVLLAIRRALCEREQVLARIEAQLEDRRQAAGEQLEATAASVERRLAGTRRDLARDNPLRAGLHFRAMVDADPRVEACSQKVDEADAALTSAVDARRRARSDLSTVAARQREMFAVLVG